MTKKVEKKLGMKWFVFYVKIRPLFYFLILLWAMLNKKIPNSEFFVLFTVVKLLLEFGIIVDSMDNKKRAMIFLTIDLVFSAIFLSLLFGILLMFAIKDFKGIIIIEILPLLFYIIINIIYFKKRLKWLLGIVYNMKYYRYVYCLI